MSRDRDPLRDDRIERPLRVAEPYYRDVEPDPRQVREDRRRKASDLIHAHYKTGPTTQVNHESLTDLVAELLEQVELAEANAPRAIPGCGDIVRTEWNARTSTGQLNSPNTPMAESYAKECGLRPGWKVVKRDVIHRPTITTPWRDA